MKNKIIILEYFISLNPNFSDVYDSKRSEGIKMTTNFCNILLKNNPNTKIYILKNYKIKMSLAKQIKFLISKTNTDWIEIIKKFGQKTKILLIAPETKNIYIRMATIIQELGLKMLNSNLKIIGLCCSKIKLIEKLEKLKIPHVKRFNEEDLFKKKIILKPDNGAGSANIFILKKRKELKVIKNKIQFNYILQKLYSGKKGSFSMVCYNGRNILLSCNKQLTFKNKQTIKQIGLHIGKYQKYKTDFKYLANLISSNFKELFGYVGVDVIKIRGEWKVLEINARLTSSIRDIDEVYGDSVSDAIQSIYLNKRLDWKKKMHLKKSKKIMF